MTRGTIKNKSTGVELKGDYSAGNYQSLKFVFQIDGTTENNVFAASEWNFTEDKPSAYEQYLKLPVGAHFTLGDDKLKRIKLDDQNYAIYYSPMPGWLVMDTAEDIMTADISLKVVVS